MTPEQDRRIVMTLDAGGTNFRFSAICGNKPITETAVLASNGNDLNPCLANIVEGFSRIREQCPVMPSAISFAFPGPADYPRGIIGDLGNLPAFRGGVALGPMLEDIFSIPVFINNDGDLFAYGEAISGFLPSINRLLEEAGSARRYRNLVGLTLGTGFGCGIVVDGKLLSGDNSISGEAWLLRNKLQPDTNAEEGVSIRAVRRVYAELAGIPLETSPEPKVIYDIGIRKEPGHAGAAVESFRRLGEVAGDALANILILIDGLAVIGGGISAAWPLFLPALVSELNGSYTDPEGLRFRRLASAAFNLEDSDQLKVFLGGEIRRIKIPCSKKEIEYDAMQRTGVGISRLGTSEAVAIGAYAFALDQLDSRQKLAFADS
jgi:glucokinase